ncbi:hypothetical protein AUJ13_02840 [Candidatus Micrarchaeota archaeon CG1_02_49_24]|nr:MAG: hypothetical protein AUJ13_02840 [Candidatus Micrarchaeota archaeon CG1_02_49_24]PIU82346.1 MAG: hypothetical protein COS70_01815 [Candidatus Micrarchaeota archaeon CG06_land_8_20_14_3_00_50_6]HII53575.1 hypothetical protein [Candidatus Micrarchaeota archaeon]
MNLTAIAALGILAVLLAGCCCITSSSLAENKSDPYQSFYGQKAAVSSTFELTLEKYSERLSTDNTKTVTVTFTATNSGTEQDDVNGGLFISDEQGRNYEANMFACSTLINPGLSKKIDCEFYEVPPSTKIVAVKMGDSIFNKGSYTKLFDLQ